MKISHLVVNGCSWTYCQGLDRPRLEGWPALVAEEFKLPVVNLAVKGSGNDAIHRRTYEYAFEDSKNNNHPFYIIAWSQTWRREAWCAKIYQPNNRSMLHDGYHIITFPHENPSNNLERALLDTWSEEDFYRKTILYRLSLDCLFKSKNIDYISSFFAPDEFNKGHNLCEEIVSNYKKRFDTTINYLLNNSNRVTDFFKIANPYPKTSCGHEGPEANKAIADYVIKEIKSKYDSIEVVSENYLSLKDYLKKTDLNAPSGTDWI